MQFFTTGPSPMAMFESLTDVGAMSFRFLRPEAREAMVAEARALALDQAPPEYGRARQRLFTKETFAEGSLFPKLRDRFQVTMRRFFDEVPDTFEPPLAFNNVMVQRYPAGEIGITPHRDGASVLNLIAIFVLEGDGDFSLCADYKGNGARIIPAPPGHVIIMKGPGFLGSREQPIHQIMNIRQERTVVILRQRA